MLCLPVSRNANVANGQHAYSIDNVPQNIKSKDAPGLAQNHTVPIMFFDAVQTSSDGV